MWERQSHDQEVPYVSGGGVVNVDNTAAACERWMWVSTNTVGSRVVSVVPSSLGRIRIWCDLLVYLGAGVGEVLFVCVFKALGWRSYLLKLSEGS